jgi:hypothetical protein
MTDTVTVYRWDVKDTTSPWRKKRDPWRTLPNAMTEADAADYARKEGVDLRPVPGSAETRTPASGETGSLWPPKS